MAPPAASRTRGSEQLCLREPSSAMRTPAAAGSLMRRVRARVRVRVRVKVWVRVRVRAGAGARARVRVSYLGGEDEARQEGELGKEAWLGSGLG